MPVADGISTVQGLLVSSRSLSAHGNDARPMNYSDPGSTALEYDRFS